MYDIHVILSNTPGSLPHLEVCWAKKVCALMDRRAWTVMGRFFFHVMGALAEMERELIVERTRAGLAAAREDGRIGGRRPKLTAEEWAQAGRLIAAGESRKRVAIIYDVGVSTLYIKFPARC